MRFHYIITHPNPDLAHLQIEGESGYYRIEHVTVIPRLKILQPETEFYERFGFGYIEFPLLRESFKQNDLRLSQQN